MKDFKCGCGKEGRYIVMVDGEEVGSCNKYQPCDDYDTLASKYQTLKLEYRRVLGAVNDVLVYREGTTYYNSAEDYLLSVLSKQKEVI